MNSSDLEIISVYKGFGNTGGAQDMTLLLASYFAGKDCSPLVLTATPTSAIVAKYRNSAEFRALTFGEVKAIVSRNPSAIFLSHDRKSTSRLMLFRLLLGKKLKIVHVAHNVFTDLKYLTFLPSDIIAISSAVRDNLVDYFNVSPQRITLIPNGLPDRGVRKPRKSSDIKILLAGRICVVKRQLELVEVLRNDLPDNVNLYFAGKGEDEERLTDAVANVDRIHYIGQIDIDKEIANYDYVLLFSEKEGLPLSLIEACMYGKPMITNNIPSVLDINVNTLTGFVCSDLDGLKKCLRTLPIPTSSDYAAMSLAARQRYENLFTMSEMLSAYSSLLSSVAHNHDNHDI